MTSMLLTFEDLYLQVSYFLGITAQGTAPTSNALTKCKNVVYRGYRQFLMPIDLKTGKRYVWSFIKQEGTLTTEVGKWEYQLPSGFGQLTRKFEYDASVGRPPIQHRSVSYIMSLRNIYVSNSYPKYFALRAGSFDKETGQVNEVIFHEPPDSKYILNYGYLLEPPKPTATTDVFIGGARASEVILECCLAAAEDEDERKGTNFHSAKSQQLIQQLIEHDKTFAAETVGLMRDPAVGRPISRREFEIPDAPTSVYGQTIG